MSLSRGSRNGWDRGGSTLLLDYGSSMILSYFRTKVLSYHTILPETMQALRKYGSNNLYMYSNTFESIYFRKYNYNVHYTYTYSTVNKVVIYYFRTSRNTTMIVVVVTTYESMILSKVLSYFRRKYFRTFDESTFVLLYVDTSEV